MAGTQLSNTEPACLMSLPPEMLNEIADHLELHERYLFSETCRRARRLLGMDETAWRRVFPSRAELHNNPIRDFLAGSALKMARMVQNGAVGADEVGERLRNLLISVAEEPVVDNTTDLRYRGVGVVSTPKIASGMFILHTRIEMIGVREQGDRRPVKFKHLIRPLQMCQHFCSEGGGCACNALPDDLAAASRRKGIERTGRCDHCGIDYAIIANHMGVVVESWRNLGRYDGSDDAVMNNGQVAVAIPPLTTPLPSHNLIATIVTFDTTLSLAMELPMSM
ncbi:hypothetical protein CKAH01_10195 [Colletotrichum kahawae]|uniref:F-box domain-containing protein n=1 Tax=Colletotrichum kahawae TaxID=34407 RepID=A0AAD9XWB1_COLKA|nr:hypothetical protein CKAH01_10195 [Colletotrichum kahawae]